MPRYKINAGSLIRYRYNPKYKKTLKIYDKEPLTMVLELKPDGFYGINLHYLDNPTRRAIIEGKITFNEMLKNPHIMQFIHRYLYKYVQSNIIKYIDDPKKPTRGVFVRK